MGPIWSMEGGRMMEWKESYRTRTMSAEEAISHIHSGDRVVIGHACGEPTYLVDTLVSHADSYQGVELVHMVAMGACEYVKPEMAPHFFHNALFVGAGTREAVSSGRAAYTPCFFYQVPSLFSSALPVDVAMVMVTPPNEEGKCSLGVSVDYTWEAVKKARLVIAQVNDQMPWTGPHSTVSVEDIHCFVHKSAPILQLAPPKIGAVETAIGQYCASLIQDRDTLQLGIGAIPDAVLHALTEKKDLGIHSEMLSDGIIPLIQSGVITNAYKTINPGRCVAGFLMGSQALYKFVDHNPEIELRPIDYVNHPFVIAQHDHMVSINSCVQVDLMGQVASESIGLKQISGVGGQVDFVRGAALSRGGRSIIAMPSTTKTGQSKIVPFLERGTAVTTSRNDVDYVVTEYGIAHLRGKSLCERARALIQIAHPAAQEELWKTYQERFPDVQRS